MCNTAAEVAGRTRPNCARIPLSSPVIYNLHVSNFARGAGGGGWVYGRVGQGNFLVVSIMRMSACSPGRGLACGLALDDEGLVVLVGARLHLEEQLVRRRLLDDERWALN